VRTLTAMPFPGAIRSAAELCEIYARPARPSLAKQLDHLDPHCRALIAHSPFVVMATAAADGTCDASPKGGRPGFVTVLDDHRLGIPDLSGNNRLDSITNVVSSPGIALLFLVPGFDETLRVNGRATITVDPEVLTACTVDGLRPRVVIGVDVADAYIHCAKALRRGSVWRPGEWPDVSDLPSVACMLRDHLALPDHDTEAVQKRLDESYATTMWVAGGTTR